MIYQRDIDKIRAEIDALELEDTSNQVIIDRISQLEKIIKQLDFQIQRINTDKNIARNILNSTIDKLTDSNEKLTHQNEIIAQQMQFKEVLLANVNHELRTPLNAIIGMGSLLKQTQLTPKQSKYIHIVKRSANNLMTIINDFLTLSSINAGQLELKEELFSIKEYFTELISINTLKVKDKNIDFRASLDVRIPEYFLGDPTRINQIFQNLIDNAIKFTHHGHVAIYANLLNSDADSGVIEFIVEDTGIGIPKDRQAEIFESFVQVKETKKDYMGTGLGLNIVKSLVELMKGTVLLESDAQKGSKFIIRLPLLLAKEQEVKNSKFIEKDIDIPNHWKEKRYLMIEDNPANILYAKELFNIWGLPLEIADTYKEGLSLATEKYFDIVFCDLKLPDGNGIELLKNLRNNTAAQSGQSLMFMVTASILESDRIKADKLNISGYIEKPFAPATLLKHIYQVFESVSIKDAKINQSETTDDSEKKAIEDNLQKLFKDKTSIKNEMLSIFRKQIYEEIPGIKLGIEKKDYQSVSDIAHKIKSTARIVGTQKLFSLLEELEKMGYDEVAFESMQDKSDQLCIFIDKLKKDLKPLFDELPEHSAI